MIALPLNSLSLFKALFNLKLSPGHRANRPPPAPPSRQLPIVTAFLGDDLCPAHRIFGLGLKTLFKVRPGPGGDTHVRHFKLEFAATRPGRLGVTVIGAVASRRRRRRPD